ncbi:TetR/AcrR family transcriptional regulator [Desulfosudis oleivorans]|uniref:Transcriptional regulator, TetR family n=1 Tax=Desulfosudis oleivorans (strain DSM 6200 / JCM 39069 / Hxd3) TaxID=96561 RepID=A8ZVF4_DESOH|nr:TetR/AcrR family transcriptional regulator [Desulfosudis oleivorans]ABW68141.1 transcriptional regulator, TetR family [Desulfosudis oleivorans Hxd3]
MSKKHEILEVATFLFATKGFKETSMGEVAAMSDVASATIFYHFKTKEDLFLAVLSSVKDGILEEFSHYFGEKEFTDGAARLEASVAFYLYLAGTRQPWFLLLHRYYPYKLAEENEFCRTLLEEIYNCFVDIFEKALVEGQADGSVGSLSPRKTALVLLSTVDGIVRFKNCNLYDAGALYNELMSLIGRMVK